MADSPIVIPEGLVCVDDGKVTVADSSVGLPADIADKVKGKRIVVILFVLAQSIYINLRGRTATSSDASLAANDTLVLDGIANVKNCRMLQNSGSSTVAYWVFSEPY